METPIVGIKDAQLHRDRNARDKDDHESERSRRITIKNRRKLYLDRHPSYFQSSDLELADPLLYDRCIRKFQSAAEREADGRKKGYSGILEADLYRSEAKLEALRSNSAERAKQSSPMKHVAAGNSESDQPKSEATAGLNSDLEEIPSTKEEAEELWKHHMTLRFLRGEDTEFDYQEVDEGVAWDDIEAREAQEKWFNEESPDEDGTIAGNTGIQDF